MLVRFEPSPKRLQRFLVGPLGPHIKSFANHITQQGYRPAVGWRKIYLVAGLSRWLEQKHVALRWTPLFGQENAEIMLGSQALRD